MNQLSISPTFLADIYQTALVESPNEFQKNVLDKLNEVIGFDHAWWGIMSQAPSKGFKLLSSLRYELPAAFEEHWKAVCADDTLASSVHLQPKTTIHFCKRDLYSTSGLSSLNNTFKLHQALCTSIFLPDHQSFLFISLFRSGDSPIPFKEADIDLKQLITPHLYACWKTNLVAAIERSKLENHRQGAVAFVDREGSVVCTSDAFKDLISQAYPWWSFGEKLPVQFTSKPIVNLLTEKQKKLIVEKSEVGGLYKIDIKNLSLIEKLSSRERQIAHAYSSAKTYKEIALDYSLTPATVRNYIQKIYEKLGIGNKAELVRMFDSSNYPNFSSSSTPIALDVKKSNIQGAFY